MTSRRNVFFFVAAAAAAIVSVGGCTTILGNFEVDPSLGNEAGADGAGGLGQACTTAAECPSGFCADGVCCDSKCDGVCEACNLAEKGKCAPHAAGTDPDKECKAPARPDAGPPPEPIEAGPGDAGAPDGGEEGGTVINLPDGFTQDDSACAPTCNGQRACGFPGSEKNCGTKFCNASDTAGQFACDGKGLCDVSLEVCSAYTCKGDACAKTCAAKEDCQDTHFCNAQGQCQSKLGDGIQCTLPTQCSSGFCVEGVCCNSGCGEVGGTCKDPGNVGKCICTQCQGGKTCRLFYRDADNDGYGDKDGTLPGAIAANKAVIGCVGDNAPFGFSANADDCDDGDVNARPNQTGWFTTPSATKGTFDYNCSGVVDKQLTEYPGGSCRFCGPPKTCATQSTCTASGERATLTCQLGSYLCGIPVKFCDGCGRTARGYKNVGFTAAIACGAAATYTTCGSCKDARGGVSGTTTEVRTQACH